MAFITSPEECATALEEAIAEPEVGEQAIFYLLETCLQQLSTCEDALEALTPGQLSCSGKRSRGVAFAAENARDWNTCLRMVLNRGFGVVHSFQELLDIVHGCVAQHPPLGQLVVQQLSQALLTKPSAHTGSADLSPAASLSLVAYREPASTDLTLVAVVYQASPDGCIHTALQAVVAVVQASRPAQLSSWLASYCASGLTAVTEWLTEVALGWLALPLARQGRRTRAPAAGEAQLLRGCCGAKLLCAMSWSCAQLAGEALMLVMDRLGFKDREDSGGAADAGKQAGEGTCLDALDSPLWDVLQAVSRDAARVLAVRDGLRDIEVSVAAVYDDDSAACAAVEAASVSLVSELCGNDFDAFGLLLERAAQLLLLLQERACATVQGVPPAAAVRLVRALAPLLPYMEELQDLLLGEAAEVAAKVAAAAAAEDAATCVDGDAYAAAAAGGGGGPRAVWGGVGTPSAVPLCQTPGGPPFRHTPGADSHCTGVTPSLYGRGGGVSFSQGSCLTGPGGRGHYSGAGRGMRAASIMTGTSDSKAFSSWVLKVGRFTPYGRPAGDDDHEEEDTAASSRLRLRGLGPGVGASHDDGRTAIDGQADATVGAGAGRFLDGSVDLAVEVFCSVLAHCRVVGHGQGEDAGELVGSLLALACRPSRQALAGGQRPLSGSTPGALEEVAGAGAGVAWGGDAAAEDRQLAASGREIFTRVHAALTKARTARAGAQAQAPAQTAPMSQGPEAAGVDLGGQWTSGLAAVLRSCLGPDVGPGGDRGEVEGEGDQGPGRRTAPLFDGGTSGGGQSLANCLRWRSATGGSRVAGLAGPAGNGGRAAATPRRALCRAAGSASRPGPTPPLGSAELVAPPVGIMVRALGQALAVLAFGHGSPPGAAPGAPRSSLLPGYQDSVAVLAEVLAVAVFGGREAVATGGKGAGPTAADGPAAPGCADHQQPAQGQQQQGHQPPPAPQQQQQQQQWTLGWGEGARCTGGIRGSSNSVPEAVATLQLRMQVIASLAEVLVQSPRGLGLAVLRATEPLLPRQCSSRPQPRSAAGSNRAATASGSGSGASGARVAAALRDDVGAAMCPRSPSVRDSGGGFRAASSTLSPPGFGPKYSSMSLPSMPGGSGGGAAAGREPVPQESFLDGLPPAQRAMYDAVQSAGGGGGAPCYAVDGRAADAAAAVVDAALMALLRCHKELRDKLRGLTPSPRPRCSAGDSAEGRIEGARNGAMPPPPPPPAGTPLGTNPARSCHAAEHAAQAAPAAANATPPYAAGAHTPAARVAPPGCGTVTKAARTPFGVGAAAPAAAPAAGPAAARAKSQEGPPGPWSVWSGDWAERSRLRSAGSKDPFHVSRGPASSSHTAAAAGGSVAGTPATAAAAVAVGAGNLSLTPRPTPTQAVSARDMPPPPPPPPQPPPVAPLQAAAAAPPPPPPARLPSLDTWPVSLDASLALLQKLTGRQPPPTSTPTLPEQAGRWQLTAHCLRQTAAGFRDSWRRAEEEADQEARAGGDGGDDDDARGGASRGSSLALAAARLQSFGQVAVETILAAQAVQRQIKLQADRLSADGTTTATAATAATSGVRARAPPCGPAGSAPGRTVAAALDGSETPPPGLLEQRRLAGPWVAAAPGSGSSAAAGAAVGARTTSMAAPAATAAAESVVDVSAGDGGRDGGGGGVKGGGAQPATSEQGAQSHASVVQAINPSHRPPGASSPAANKHRDNKVLSSLLSSLSAFTDYSASSVGCDGRPRRARAANQRQPPPPPLPPPAAAAAAAKKQPAGDQGKEKKEPVQVQKPKAGPTSSTGPGLTAKAARAEAERGAAAAAAPAAAAPEPSAALRPPEPARDEPQQPAAAPLSHPQHQGQQPPAQAQRAEPEPDLERLTPPHHAALAAAAAGQARAAALQLLVHVAHTARARLPQRPKPSTAATAAAGDDAATAAGAAATEALAAGGVPPEDADAPPSPAAAITSACTVLRPPRPPPSLQGDPQPHHPARPAASPATAASVHELLEGLLRQLFPFNSRSRVLRAGLSSFGTASFGQAAWRAALQEALDCPLAAAPLQALLEAEWLLQGHAAMAADDSLRSDAPAAVAAAVGAAWRARVAALVELAAALPRQRRTAAWGLGLGAKALCQATSAVSRRMLLSTGSGGTAHAMSTTSTRTAACPGVSEPSQRRRAFSSTSAAAGVWRTGQAYGGRVGRGAPTSAPTISAAPTWAPTPSAAPTSTATPSAAPTSAPQKSRPPPHGQRNALGEGGVAGDVPSAPPAAAAAADGCLLDGGTAVRLAALACRGAVPWVVLGVASKLLALPASAFSFCAGAGSSPTCQQWRTSAYVLRSWSEPGKGRAAPTGPIPGGLNASGTQAAASVQWSSEASGGHVASPSHVRRPWRRKSLAAAPSGTAAVTGEGAAATRGEEAALLVHERVGEGGRLSWCWSLAAATAAAAGGEGTEAATAAASAAAARIVEGRKAAAFAAASRVTTATAAATGAVAGSGTATATAAAAASSAAAAAAVPAWVTRCTPAQAVLVLLRLAAAVQPTLASATDAALTSDLPDALAVSLGCCARAVALLLPAPPSPVGLRTAPRSPPRTMAAAAAATATPAAAAATVTTPRGTAAPSAARAAATAAASGLYDARRPGASVAACTAEVAEERRLLAVAADHMLAALECATACAALLLRRTTEESRRGGGPAAADAGGDGADGSGAGGRAAPAASPPGSWWLCLAVALGRFHAPDVEHMVQELAARPSRRLLRWSRMLSRQLETLQELDAHLVAYQQAATAAAASDGARTGVAPGATRPSGATAAGAAAKGRAQPTTTLRPRRTAKAAAPAAPLAPLMRRATEQVFGRAQPHAVAAVDAAAAAPAPAGGAAARAAAPCSPAVVRGGASRGDMGGGGGGLTRQGLLSPSRGTPGRSPAGRQSARMQQPDSKEEIPYEPLYILWRASDGDEEQLEVRVEELQGEEGDEGVAQHEQHPQQQQQQKRLQEAKQGSQKKAPSRCASWGGGGGGCGGGSGCEQRGKESAAAGPEATTRAAAAAAEEAGQTLEGRRRIKPTLAAAAPSKADATAAAGRHQPGAAPALAAAVASQHPSAAPNRGNSAAAGAAGGAAAGVQPAELRHQSQAQGLAAGPQPLLEEAEAEAAAEAQAAGPSKAKRKRRAARRQPKNPYLAACLREISGRESGSDDDWSDLEDFIVCQPDRDYTALFNKRLRYAPVDDGAD